MNRPNATWIGYRLQTAPAKITRTDAPLRAPLRILACVKPCRTRVIVNAYQAHRMLESRKPMIGRRRKIRA